jgi:hypothetical protein
MQWPFRETALETYCLVSSNILHRKTCLKASGDTSLVKRDDIYWRRDGGRSLGWGLTLGGGRSLGGGLTLCAGITSSNTGLGWRSTLGGRWRG